MILAPPKVNKSPVGIRGKIRGTLVFAASPRIFPGHRLAPNSPLPAGFVRRAAVVLQGSVKQGPCGRSARAVWFVLAPDPTSDPTVGG